MSTQTSSQKTTPAKLLEAVRAGQAFVVTSHINPDGDAIGSSIGLARLLQSMGKKVQVWIRDETPRTYLPLVGSDAIHNGDTPPPSFPEGYDGVLVLECPTLERSGLEDAITQLPLYNIDHHLGNANYGVVNWVDPEAPAVGCLVYRMARDLGQALDADAAMALYLALHTDTGNFRFSNTTAEAFDVAAELVRAGAAPDRVAHWLYESQPPSALRLLAEVLHTLKLYDDGRVATLRLERETALRVGATPSDTEGLIDYPRSIAGVEAVALVRDLEDGRVKASLRSRGSVDVEKIARANGGGGHRNAAGFTLPEPQPIHEVEEKVASLLAEALPAV